MDFLSWTKMEYILFSIFHPLSAATVYINYTLEGTARQGEEGSLSRKLKTQGKT